MRAGRCVACSDGIASFLFCGTDLIAPGIKLAGPVLHIDEGLMMSNQVFAFDEERNTLRVRAEGTSAGEPIELTATLPVTSDFVRCGVVQLDGSTAKMIGSG